MKNIPLFKVFMPDGVSSAVEKTLLSGYLAEGGKVQDFTQVIKHITSGDVGSFFFGEIKHSKETVII